MVLGPSLVQSYIISADGLTKSSPVITGPSDDFAKNSRFAIVKGILYIFGGFTDNHKVKLAKKFEKEKSIS